MAETPADKIGTGQRLGLEPSGDGIRCQGRALRLLRYLGPRGPLQVAAGQLRQFPGAGLPEAGGTPQDVGDAGLGLVAEARASRPGPRCAG